MCEMSVYMGIGNNEQDVEISANQVAVIIYQYNRNIAEPDALKIAASRNGLMTVHMNPNHSPEAYSEIQSVFWEDVYDKVSDMETRYRQKCISDIDI